MLYSESGSGGRQAIDARLDIAPKNAESPAFGRGLREVLLHLLNRARDQRPSIPRPVPSNPTRRGLPFEQYQPQELYRPRRRTQPPGG